ncbi:MAG: phosphoglycerate mutase family protein [bacterium]
MDVLLVRHGKAEERDAGRWPDDRLRPLTPKGMAESHATGAALAMLGLGLSTHWTSPFTRAQQTAEGLVVGSGHALPLPQDNDLLGDQFSVANLTQALAGLPAETRIVLVGHQPDLSELAAAWLGSKADQIELKKGSVALFDLDQATGRGILRWLMPVRALMGLRGAQ